jgi:hypothetical protein
MPNVRTRMSHAKALPSQVLRASTTKINRVMDGHAQVTARRSP